MSPAEFSEDCMPDLIVDGVHLAHDLGDGTCSVGHGQFGTVYKPEHAHALAKWLLQWAVAQ